MSPDELPKTDSDGPDSGLEINDSAAARRKKLGVDDDPGEDAAEMPGHPGPRINEDTVKGNEGTVEGNA